MQPTPELTVKVKDEALRDWCEKQGISVPRVRIYTNAKKVSEAVALGEYDPGSRTIYLYVGSDALAKAEGQRLLYVTRQLNETFLHELRHHWQHHTWSAKKLDRANEGPYWNRPSEVDAREFQAAYRTKLTLITVKRSFGGGRISGFGRLGAAQEGARR